MCSEAYLASGSRALLDYRHGATRELYRNVAVPFRGTDLLRGLCMIGANLRPRL